MKRARWIVLASCTLPAMGVFSVACGDDARETFATETDASNADVPVRVEASVDPPAPATAPDASDEPVQCKVTPCATQLVAGAHHFCALLATKTVACWGDSTSGALGAGDAGTTDGGPVAVIGLGGVTQLSAAGATTCALLGGGELRCWGDNGSGQLGTGASDARAHGVPTTVALPAAATRVDVGLGASCATLGDGTLSCWGANGSRQLARDDAGAVGAPGRVPISTPMIRTGSDARTTYALTQARDVLAWGSVSGRAGSVDPDPDPAELTALKDVSGLSAGPAHVCAIASGEVRCWSGRAGTDSAPLCTGLPDREPVPVLAPLPTGATVIAQQISVSRRATCARLTDGSLYCCGEGASGQLGRPADAGAALSFVPIRIGGARIVQVATADETTCVLDVDGAVRCWGGNAHGELAKGPPDEDAHPAPVVISFR